MNEDLERSLDPRMQQAVAELRETIRQHYPEARFELSRGYEDPAQVLLFTAVDLDDPEEVLDLVLDRLLELEVDEGLPLYVIPTPTPERTLAQLHSSQRPKYRVHVGLISVDTEQASDESA